MTRYAALIYEQWRNTRKLFAVALAVSFIPCILVFVSFFGIHSRHSPEYDLSKFYTIAGLNVANFYWLMVLVAAPGGGGDLKLTIPRFLMRLPVSAWNLAAARMSFGIASSAILALSGTAFYYLIFDERMEQALPYYALLLGYPRSRA